MVYLNGTVKCTTETDANGNYNCDFNAPGSLGLYQLNTTLKDPLTNIFWSNTTTFQVKVAFGAPRAEEVEAENIACYEEPRVIQNPDGSLKVSFVRVCVWR